MIHESIASLAEEEKHFTKETYGTNRGQFFASNINVDHGFFEFDLKGPGLKIEKIQLGVPGFHNMENAIAATMVAMKLGIDSVHFGILIDANMEVGLCHPPVGLNLYVASGISKLSITELAVAVLPWLTTMLVFLVIVTYWPGLSLWLPRAMGMM